MSRPLGAQSREYGAQRKFRTPKTLTLKMARAAASEASSTAAISPKPALLTRTSIRPKRAMVASTASRICRSSVTSTFAGSKEGDVPNARRIAPGSRALAVTLWPRAKASRTVATPSPQQILETDEGDPLVDERGQRSPARLNPSLIPARDFRRSLAPRTSQHRHAAPPSRNPRF
jgi:hypothetical protein